MSEYTVEGARKSVQIIMGVMHGLSVLRGREVPVSQISLNDAVFLVLKAIVYLDLYLTGSIKDRQVDSDYPAVEQFLKHMKDCNLPLSQPETRLFIQWPREGTFVVLHVDGHHIMEKWNALYVDYEPA